MKHLIIQLNIYEAANLKMAPKITLLTETSNVKYVRSLKKYSRWYEASSTSFLSLLCNLKYIEI